MKTFKAIIYAILLMIWLLFTIVFVVTIFPIAIICISGIDEWFDFKDNILDEFKKL